MGNQETPAAVAGPWPVPPPRGFIVLVSVLAILVSPATHALEVSEVEAITAALLRANYSALEISRRAAAEADVEQAGLPPNPEASFTREGFTTAGGRSIETAYEISQQIDLAGIAVSPSTPRLIASAQPSGIFNWIAKTS